MTDETQDSQPTESLAFESLSEELKQALSEMAQEQRNWTIHVMDLVYKNQAEIDAKQDAILDQFEKQLAMVLSGYAELAALVETLVSSTFNKSEEEREEFFKHLGDARKTMIETMRHAVQEVNQNGDKFVPYSTGTFDGSDGNPVSSE